MQETERPRQAALAFILVTLFIDILGIGIIVPVLPQLIKEFLGGGSSLAGRYSGVITACYALMQFLFAPIMGAMSDRFGRRPVLLASLFGLGVDFLIQGFAPNIGWLFVGRLLAGAMGASITTANAYIADVSTPETRARNFGFVGMMFGLGFIFGPSLGGLLGDVHIRLPFFVSAALALLNWLYGFFILPESLPPERRGRFTWSKASPLGSLERLRAYPFVANLAVVLFFMAMAQRGLENVWVLYTDYRYEWSKRTNGLVLGLVGLMAAIVQGGLVRPIIQRYGERRSLSVGLLISAVAFLGYGLSPYGWMIPLILILGSLGGISGPSIQSLVAGVVDPTEQGTIQGALTSVMSMTSIIAPLVFTSGLFSYFTSEQALVQLPGAPFLVGSIMWILAWFVVRDTLRRHPETGR